VFWLAMFILTRKEGRKEGTANVFTHFPCKMAGLPALHATRVNDGMISIAQSDRASKTFNDGVHAMDTYSLPSSMFVAVTMARSVSGKE